MSDDSTVGRITFGPRTPVGCGDGNTFVVDTAWYEREIERLKADHAAALAAKDAEIAELHKLVELREAEASSGWEAWGVLSCFLGWSSGGLGAAAIETVARAERAEQEAAGLRADALRYRTIKAAPWAAIRMDFDPMAPIYIHRESTDDLDGALDRLREAARAGGGDE